jgi:hypothetical protein
MQKNALIKTTDNKKVTNFYVVKNFMETLEEAEKRAEKLLELSFKTSLVGKDFFTLALGKDVAEEVFPDKRSISPKSRKNQERIESIILKTIEAKGFITKEMLLKDKKLKNTPKEQRKRDVEKFLPVLLKKNDLVFKKPTKQEIESFNLKKQSFIITKAS